MTKLHEYPAIFRFDGRAVHVKVTHIPTGVSVETCIERSAHNNNKALALECLRSKVVALYSAGIDTWEDVFNSPVVASYEFPDNVEYPNDITQYRVGESDVDSI